MIPLNNLFHRQWHNFDQCASFQPLFSHLEQNYGFKLDEPYNSWHKDRHVKLLSHLERKRHQHVVNLSFFAFWPTFPTTCNPIVHLFEFVAKHMGIQINIVELGEATDIVICGCYSGFVEELPDHCIRICYLPEPVYPDYSFFDFSISQYPNHLGGKNIYLPLYLLELQLPFMAREYRDRCEQPISIRELYHPCINLDLSNRKFACIALGNQTPLRSVFLSRLIERGYTVDIYGTRFKNRLPCKYDISNQYIFNLCFESAYMPGYISEKIIHAKCMGMIPVYSGFAGESTEFNKEAYINHSASDNIDDTIDTMVRISKKVEMQAYILREPLLTKPMKLMDIYSGIMRIYRKVLSIPASS